MRRSSSFKDSDTIFDMIYAHQVPRYDFNIVRAFQRGLLWTDVGPTGFPPAVSPPNVLTAGDEIPLPHWQRSGLGRVRTMIDLGN